MPGKGLWSRRSVAGFLGAFGTQKLALEPAHLNDPQWVREPEGAWSLHPLLAELLRDKSGGAAAAKNAGERPVRAGSPMSPGTAIQ